MKRKTLLITVMTAAILSVMNCEVPLVSEKDAGSGIDTGGSGTGGTGGGSGIPMTTVLGSTPVTWTGGSETENVVFALDVPSASVNAASGDYDHAAWVPLAGKIRFGAKSADLTGSYNSSAKLAVFTSMGSIAGVGRIEATAIMTHDPGAGTLSGGEITISFWDTPTDIVKVYRSESISSTTAKPSDFTTQHFPPVAEDFLFYSGVSKGSYTSYGAVLGDMWRTYAEPAEGLAAVENRYVVALTRRLILSHVISYFDGSPVAEPHRQWNRFNTVTVDENRIELHFRPITDGVPEERYLLTKTAEGVRVEQYGVFSGPYNSMQVKLNEVLNHRDFETYEELPPGWEDPRNWTQKIDAGIVQRID
jgi:hypothetical protein